MARDKEIIDMGFKARLIVLGIIMFIAGIWLTVDSISDIIKLNGNVPDFNYESIADIKKGDFVCGYIANIFGNYANETTTNTTMGIETSSRVSKEYFVMPLINEEDEKNQLYITISASKREDINLLTAIMYDTYDYLDGVEDIDWHEMAFVGHAVKLDSELNKFLVEWFEDAEIFDGSIQSHIIPYELVCYDTSNVYTNLIIGLVLIGICVVVVLVIYFKFFRPHKASDNSGFVAPDTGNAFAEAPSEAAPSADTHPLMRTDYVNPDDFFAKPERPAANADAVPETPKPTEAPKPPAPEPVQEAPAPDYSAGIDTEALDVEKALHEQEQAVAANRKTVEGSQGIDTDTLDTDKALYEQEQAVAANQKPIENNQGIETHELDTDKALYEQEQAVAANRKTVENNQGIDTDTLDVDKALYEQEQAVASNTKVLEDNGGIDTSEMDTEALGYFDQSAAGDDTDDIFEFDEDYDYGDVDASNIEIT